MSGPISQFIRQHYRHFNAATLVDAAEDWVKANWALSLPQPAPENHSVWSIWGLKHLKREKW